jgi:hypothetical protein
LSNVKTCSIDNTKINKQLKMEESLICGGKFNIEECINAIFKMRLSRSPGYDGITAEFYKIYSTVVFLFVV